MRWFVPWMFLLAIGCSSDKTNCRDNCSETDDAVASDARADGSSNSDGAATDTGRQDVGGSLDGGPVDTLDPTDASGPADVLGAFDGGDIMPTDPICQQMLACCPNVPRDQQPGCYGFAEKDNVAVCQRLLRSYQTLGYCEVPDAGPPIPLPDAGPATCKDLAGCCIVRRRNPIPMCEEIATGGDEQACWELFVREGCD